MSFGGLGGGLIGGALASMVGGALDTVLGSDDVMLTPIPAFYFEVLLYDDETKYKKAEIASSFGESEGGLGGALAGAMGAAQGMVSGPNTLQPGEYDNTWWQKSFIEVSGLEMGLEGKKTFNEGGYNYPIDLPDKMKNTAVTLKRLVRPNSWTDQDPWKKWYDETFNAMAYWETTIKTKIVQINIMHPNLKEKGETYILASIDLYDAYPSKVIHSSLNSTSEDLLVEEIEISYSNKYGGYNTTAG